MVLKYYSKIWHCTVLLNYQKKRLLSLKRSLKILPCGIINDNDIIKESSSSSFSPNDGILNNDNNHKSNNN